MRKRFEIGLLVVLSLTVVVNALHSYKLNLEREAINQRWEFIVSQYEIQTNIIQERMNGR